MRKIQYLLFSALFATTASSASAESSYVGIGLGIQFNLASLQNTIVLDGLDSPTVGYPNLDSAQTLTGCGAPTVGNSCLEETRGNFQQLIPAENTLIALERNTAGLIRSTTRGGMIGLVLDVFYEQEFSSSFIRAGVQYTDKVLGGHTESYVFKGSPIETKWLNIKWDYYSWTIPFYYGLKAGVGENASVYGGLGINYSQGGWNLGGRNWGDIPGLILGLNTGVQTAQRNGQLVANPVGFEAAKFRVNGFGLNFLIGLETKLESGNKVFFEIEQIFAGDQGITITKDDGGTRGLSGSPAYPINLGGQKFKFGYKLAL